MCTHPPGAQYFPQGGQYLDTPGYFHPICNICFVYICPYSECNPHPRWWRARRQSQQFRWWTRGRYFRCWWRTGKETEKQRWGILQSMWWENSSQVGTIYFSVKKVKGLSVIVNSKLCFFPQTPQIFLHIQRELHCNCLSIQQLSWRQHIFGKRDNFLLLGSNYRQW